jgi:hypothetical protein
VIKVLRNDSTTQTLPGPVVVRQVAFAPLTDRPSGDCPVRVLSGDVTGDGRRDLVTVNASCGRGTDPGTVQVNRNTLPPVLQSIGACCGPAAQGGLCALSTIGECVNALGGTFQGAFTTCGPVNPCPFGPTACCRGSTCVLVAVSTACTGAYARAAGVNTVCNTPGNRTAPCCMADFNHSGSVTVQDIFDFLGAYFGGQVLLVDINATSTLTVQDIFDFLAAYFTGCS